ncbi:MAG TPA: hypothetical protein VK149_11800 [Sideroxyarcus sp.]|nr:hypothetical protein [Sideroxyarcus sp.]
MTEQPDDNRAAEADGAEPPDYVYTSAGIAERQGNVPIWLWIVVISLLVWGIYYLIVYWDIPTGSS